MISMHVDQKQHYGLESVSFLGQKLWRELPLHTKNSQTLQIFKTAMKNWNFTCNLQLKIM